MCPNLQLTLRVSAVYMSQLLSASSLSPFAHLVVYALMVDLAGDEARRHKSE